MKATDWQEVIGTIGLFALVLTVVGAVVWQLGVRLRAKVGSPREDEYRELARSAVQVQENTERQLAEQGRTLAEMNARLQVVEAILKDAE
jgi:hypothetical protein